MIHRRPLNCNFHWRKLASRRSGRRRRLRRGRCRRLRRSRRRSVVGRRFIAQLLNPRLHEALDVLLYRSNRSSQPAFSGTPGKTRKQVFVPLKPRVRLLGRSLSPLDEVGGARRILAWKCSAGCPPYGPITARPMRVRTMNIDSKRMRAPRDLSCARRLLTSRFLVAPIAHCSIT